MMSWYYSNFRPYVPVGERRARALKKLEKLRRKGVTVRPVEARRGTIARTFWGKAWCGHLEKFSDYENRLPRGRSYVRNGSVCHLEINEGMINALVAGTDLYHVDVTIRKMPKRKWRRIKARCEGRIGSLLELLQGRISRGVMEVVTERDQGLFPLPREIGLNCDCPDWAVMCKHVAAVLYGVGARLDERPELLFLLRGVDHHELIGSEADLIASATGGKKAGRRRIAEGDLESVFGIELAEEEPAKTGKQGRGRNKAKPGRRRARAESKKRRKRPKTPVSVRAGLVRGTGGIRAVTGGEVRKLRAKLRMSQNQFASLLGVSAATIANWEKTRGRLNLHARTRKALSRVAAGGGKRISNRP